MMMKDDELWRILKETIVSSFKVLPHTFSKGIKGTHKKKRIKDYLWDDNQNRDLPIFVRTISRSVLTLY
jgi:hypothetical protein